MYSLCSSEFVRRSTWTCLSCSTLSRITAGPLTPSLSNASYRKYSSSKTPSPPKDETRSIATPSDTPGKDTKSVVKENTEKCPNTRLSKRKSKDGVHDLAWKSSNELKFKLPSVPKTSHLHAGDVHMSNFFSLHRPISVTKSVPPESSPAQFSSIFDPKPISNHKTTDVIYTLSSAVDTFENTSSSTPNQKPPYVTEDEFDLRAAVTEASPSNADPPPHLIDLPAKIFQINLQELVKGFRPYMKPPAPSPMASTVLEEAPQKTNQSDEPQWEAVVSQKTFTTTLTIHENTYRSGRRYYKTHTTPIIEDPSPFAGEREKGVYVPPVPRGQPFLGRMRERQIQYIDRLDDGETWHTISVKRQRKLKMKKHKYKKLMKRTKNLRRRLDRT